MAICTICKRTSQEIANEVGTCLDCLRKRPEEALPVALQAHGRSRSAFGLPEFPPIASDGIPCRICMHECRIPEGGVGYCGLRRNEEGRIVDISSERGKLSWYHDPLPTNCVGDWVCPGGTGAGFPRYAHCPGPEFGYKSLAVFFQACSFNCLYCQNWTFKTETFQSRTRSIDELVDAVDETTACICYFGGDPVPQLPFSLKASERALEKVQGKILRICWETNGSMNPAFLEKMIDLALKCGGCIKFDLKAWDENLHIALTGVSNKRTLENFARAGQMTKLRGEPPLLIASTLLVPGYIDENEIQKLAEFIAAIDRDIPYSLLAFHPHFFMADLPLISRTQAQRFLAVAEGEGLNRVRIGNVHLLA